MKGGKTVFNKDKGKRSQLKSNHCYHLVAPQITFFPGLGLTFSGSRFLNVDSTLDPGRQRPSQMTCGFCGEKYYTIGYSKSLDREQKRTSKLPFPVT